MSQDLLQRARDIRLAVFDVDGVLTDGKLYFLPDGSEFKTFNTLDGQGIKMLIQSGVRTAIITGRSSPVVERRAGNLASTTCSRAARTNWWHSMNYSPNCDSNTTRSPTSATTCPTCQPSAGSDWAWRWPMPRHSFASTPTA